MHEQQVYSLPVPDADSAAHSERVADYIRDRIREAGGEIPFADFMHHCLYAPGLGYYSAGSRKFGRSGDFVTAPEISGAFGAIVARQCAVVLQQSDAPQILEFGAGTGRLAVDIVSQLAPTMPRLEYRILEVSADLRERQEALIGDEIPELAGRVGWERAMPQGFSGVVIANEVLDALPVERFVRHKEHIGQVCVVSSGAGFGLIERRAPDRLTEAVAGIERFLGRPLPEGYESEICLAAPQWLADVSRALETGIILLFDYGVGRRDYYSADRSGGWLRCHFRHRAHNDPLILPGIQDLTAWVDFTAIAEEAIACGLHVDGFLTQAQFLIGGGLDGYLAEFAELPTDAQLKLSAEIKLLTLPSEMGEHFKCLALRGGDVATPAVFGGADRTASLG